MRLVGQVLLLIAYPTAALLLYPVIWIGDKDRLMGIRALAWALAGVLGIVAFLILFVEAPSEFNLAGNAYALSREARIGACYLGGLFVAISIVLLAGAVERKTPTTIG
jgi:hypothetical protein